MRVLFVTPNPRGAGEAITALHMAAALAGGGDQVHFLASQFTARFLRSELAAHQVTLLSEQPTDCWRGLVRSFRPQVVVFADFPLLYFSPAGMSLVDSDWVAELDSLEAVAATLDHLGMARGPMVLHFGPPHLDLYGQPLPALPPGLEVLLPCPVHEPAPVPGRRGTPFRYWRLPLEPPAERRRHVRRRYLQDEGDLLLFHSVPSWAVATAERFGLPNYRFLARLLDGYLAGLPRRLTLVSVNGGSLLAPSALPGVRFVNLPTLSRREYEELLFAADLMLTDNRVSVSLGKAACGRVPSVALRNSFGLLELLERPDRSLRRLLLQIETAREGAIFPFEVFPIWSRRDLEKLGVFEDNTFETVFETIEIYGGDASRRALHELLTDRRRRESLGARQSRYAAAVEALPGPRQVIRQLSAAA